MKKAIKATRYLASYSRSEVMTKMCSMQRVEKLKKCYQLRRSVTTTTTIDCRTQQYNTISFSDTSRNINTHYNYRVVQKSGLPCNLWT